MSSASKDVSELSSVPTSQIRLTGWSQKAKDRGGRITIGRSGLGRICISEVINFRVVPAMLVFPGPCEVISKRMVKRQSMQWTPRGAHLLLQTRTRVLNDELEGSFRSWYPQFRPITEKAA